MIEDVDSELLVQETFKNLFPESFDGVLPVRKHKVPLSCCIKESPYFFEVARNLPCRLKYIHSSFRFLTGKASRHCKISHRESQ